MWQIARVDDQLLLLTLFAFFIGKKELSNVFSIASDLCKYDIGTYLCSDEGYKYSGDSDYVVYENSNY